MKKNNPEEIKFDPSSFEEKWQAEWEKAQLFSPQLDSAKKPYFNLMMFPYPSAEGLHVGNMYAFTGADIYGRFQRMQGNDVFEPIGLDGFGIHSENYALKVGRHPKDQTRRAEENFYRQLRSIGNSFDWSRKLETYDPLYYRWTQWLFVKLFQAGLAYRKKAEVNWCPSCKTVLSDEQVIEGKCERCNSSVEKKDLEQWFFRITSYADRLLSNIEGLDWTEKVKIAQRLWIGKAEDTEIKFLVKDLEIKIPIITTRADTIFGATFLVIAPEHNLVQELKDKIKNWIDVESYIIETKKKNEFERGLAKEKTGIILEGLTVINPLNNREIPLYIADYVLSTYGTGAIMGVPAHDDRDYAFAKKFDLPIEKVIEQSSVSSDIRAYIYDNDRSDVAQELRSIGTPMEYWTPTQRAYSIALNKIPEIISSLKSVQAGDQESYGRIQKGNSFALEMEPQSIDFGLVYSGDGKHINSEFLNGMNKEEAINKIIAWLSERNLGGKSVHYHLRDWLISRQRYWGPPIPMIYCSSCFKNGKGVRPEMPGWYAVPEADLPVLLPDVEDWKPMGTGLSPLANHPEFYETICPGCNGPAKRETDVSDTFLDSAWYFLGYISDIITRSKNSGQDGDPRTRESVSRGITLDQETFTPWDKTVEKAWLPVKKYIGGAEHSVLHLLYARFIAMVLYDLKLVDFEEPFSSFFAHGLIIKDGAKMSKSKGNVVVPDEYLAKYGADTLRTYLMFLGPFSDGGDFKDSGIEGMHRFLRRIWTLFQKSISNSQFQISNELSNESNFQMNKTIKKVTLDILEFKYNTAIAALMEYYNFLSDQKELYPEEIEVFLKLLAPFAPFMTEELWQRVCAATQIDAEGKSQNHANFNSIHTSPWPELDPKHLESNEVTMVIQVNGKRRGQLTIDNSHVTDEEHITIQAQEMVKSYLENNTVKKVIYVPGKIINFVV